MNQKLQIEFRRLGFILVNKRPYKSIVRGAFLCEICVENLMVIFFNEFDLNNSEENISDGTGRIIIFISFIRLIDIKHQLKI